ncbi:hypothetical protein MMC10_002765 [Thelotrema lepadinum]|nr:hypothetical protein [Thelotrema lepadinum]
MSRFSTATLTTIPVELRFEIYSYLLLTFNNTDEVRKRNDHFDPRCQECTVWIPQISTSLFIVNKQISLEALRYFYRKNAFVAIRTPFMAVAHNSRFVVPRFFWTPPESDEASLKGLKMQCLRKVGLLITFNSKPSALPDRYDVSPPSRLWTLVFSLRFLPIMVRLINRVHFAWLRLDDAELHLDFRLGTSYYTDNARIADIMISSVKGFKSYYRDNGRPYLKLSISGTIDKASVDSIRNTTLSPHSREDPITDCEWIAQLGDMERSRGNFDLAENFYKLIAYFTGKPWYARPEEKRLTFWCKIWLIRLFLRLANIGLEIGSNKRACASLISACREASPDWREGGPNKILARMYYQIGEALDDRRHRGERLDLCRAVAELDDTLWLAIDPRLEADISMKLDKVKAALLDLGLHPVPLSLLDLKWERRDIVA